MSLQCVVQLPSFELIKIEFCFFNIVYIYSYLKGQLIKTLLILFILELTSPHITINNNTPVFIKNIKLCSMAQKLPLELVYLDLIFEDAFMAKMSRLDALS